MTNNLRLNELSFTVFDTETTGLSPAKGAKLVEIAAVRIYPNLSIDMKDVFCQLINPECPIGDEAYSIHKISNDMVKNEPTSHSVLPQFMEFAKGSVLVAHNARFDMSFIENERKLSDTQPTYTHVLDTMKIARQAFPTLKRYGLDNLINQLKISIDVDNSYRHRALFDAAHTSVLLIKSILELEKNGIKYIHELL